MKFLFYAFSICTFIFIGCSPKVQGTTVTKNNTECKDTAVKVVFINTKNVELNIHILKLSSRREGNTIINTWNKFQNLKLVAGGDNSIYLNVKGTYMYDAYGPVSTNVTGVGVIATKKLVLIPCQIITEEF
jgi:hypothetical protein